MIATDGKLKHLSNGCFTIQNRSTERLALSFDTSTALSASLRGNRATCTERSRSKSRFNYGEVERSRSLKSKIQNGIRGS
ncbi:hypothetical protein [Nostoc sp. DSM 114160]|jgi:hypothetical protein